MRGGTPGLGGHSESQPRRAAFQADNGEALIPSTIHATVAVSSRLPRARSRGRAAFYGELLGCPEGRSSTALGGLRLLRPPARRASRSGAAPRAPTNAVDGDDVPVPHFGVVLAWDDGTRSPRACAQAGVTSVIEPGIRFAGQVGEQATFFLRRSVGQRARVQGLPRSLAALRALTETRRRPSSSCLSCARSPRTSPGSGRTTGRRRTSRSRRDDVQQDADWPH